MRLFVLLLAAVASLAEAIAFGAVAYVLGDIIGAYGMSMGTLSGGGGRAALWVLGAVLAACLVAVAALLVVAAVRGRPLGRTARALTVAALAVDGLVGLVLLFTGSPLAALGVLAGFSCLLAALLYDTSRVPAAAL